MKGKIGLEEHFAIEDTIMDSHGFLPEEIWPELKSRLLDVQEKRLGFMDKFDMEMMILSLNAPAIQAIPDTSKADEIARRSNDALAEEVAKRPDRFRSFAALPMQDVDAAITELQRCVNDLGFVGALVNGFTQKDVADSAVYFDIPEYRPFWAAVEELGGPFYLPPRTQIPARMQPYEGHPWLISASWGFARETSIHALRLIGSGLFDAHPNLQIIMGHLGERIPYDMWRIDHRIRKIPNGFPCKKEMGDYLRENFHFTTAGNFNDPTLECCIAEMGIDRVMFSVDYPFEDTIDAASWFDSNGLSDADRLQIGRQNAIDLFKLDLS